MIETLQIAVCRKPTEGGFVDNALGNGVGSINIDGCRIPSNGESFVINTWDDGSKPFGGGAGHNYTSR